MCPDWRVPAGSSPLLISTFVSVSGFQRRSNLARFLGRKVGAGRRHRGSCGYRPSPGWPPAAQPGRGPARDREQGLSLQWATRAGTPLRA